MVKERKNVITKIIREEVSVEKHRYCNKCGKEILKGYFSATTHCEDWGEDSYDSYAYYDLCSKNCVKDFFDGWIKDVPDDENNTEIIEIVHVNTPF